MKKLLFLDACIRGEDSRTRQLCETYLETYLEKNPDTQVISVSLIDQDIAPLTYERIKERDGYIAAKDFDHPMFDLAKQLKEADVVVVGTPYYDFSFASVLKVYVENIVVCDLTFESTETGLSGLCNGEKLVYITTAGGSMTGKNYGYEYMDGLARDMLGFRETECFKAEMLDVVGFDVDAILEETKAQIRASLE